MIAITFHHSILSAAGCAVMLRLCAVIFQSTVPTTRSKRQFHRVFRLSNQLYIYKPDLCVFLPLDDMPNDLPQQLWSAVTALKGIDNGRDHLLISACSSIRCYTHDMKQSRQCCYMHTKFCTPSLPVTHLLRFLAAQSCPPTSLFAPHNQPSPSVASQKHALSVHTSSNPFGNKTNFQL